MEVSEDSGTQCAKSEKGIISFLPKSGDRQHQHSGDIIVTAE